MQSQRRARYNGLMEPSTITTLLLDGDGVLYHEKTPVPGLLRFFNLLAERGIRWALVTNNATRTRAEYVVKLADFGIHATVDQVFTSALASASFLRHHFGPGAPIYVVGSDGLKNEMRSVGLVVCDGESVPTDAQAVIVGLDRQITYGKIAAANRLIRNGLPYFATNPDRTYPMEDGLAPGAGTIVAAVTAACGVEPRFLGKPETAFFDTALLTLGAAPEHSAMLGDRMDTDILGALRAGMSAILVLSGVTKAVDLPAYDYQPHLVLPGLEAVSDWIEGAHAPG